jgi:hypothetical protein
MGIIQAIFRAACLTILVQIEVNVICHLFASSGRGRSSTSLSIARSSRFFHSLSANTAFFQPAACQLTTYL